MRSPLRLKSVDLDATVDLERGAEIATLHDRRTGTGLLLVTPWAERARSVRPVRLAHPAAASRAAWMESYAGGWQTLFPHAGPPRVVDGTERHFHGEASSVPWQLDSAAVQEVRAHVELVTVPVRVDRVVTIDGACIAVADTLTNLSHIAVTYDYQSHPAFGAPFLEDGCTISTDAPTYVPDPTVDLGEFAPGVPVDPHRAGLGTVPAAGRPTVRFGWLEGLRERRVTVRNPRTGIEVVLAWDEPERSLAWLWEEIHASRGSPWFGRGYTVAAEPSTRPTGPPDAPSPSLAPGGRAHYRTTITVGHVRDHDEREG